jgi:uncharacterized protein
VRSLLALLESMFDLYIPKPIQQLEEDFADVASYLRTASGASPTPTQAIRSPSQHYQNIASEQLTSSLIESVQDVMSRAEADGRDPDDEIRQVVSRTVVEGVLSGYQMTERDGNDIDIRGPNGVKRPRTTE